MTNRQGIIDDLLSEVAEREGCRPDEIEWWAWPQSFPTTAGPVAPAGARGNMPASFQVFGFRPPNGRTQKWCCGYWRHWNGQVGQNW